MTRDELLARRWAAHRLGPNRSPAPPAAVAWAGALQAQDETMSLLAAGLRSAAATEASVGADLEAGRLIRAHVLRPTWHLVTAEDHGWLTALTGPGIRRALKTSYRQAGVGDDLVDLAVKIILETLQEGPADREAFREGWVRAGLPIQQPLASHYLIEAEARGLVCQAGRSEPTARYDLTERRLPTPARLPEDEALARLGQRYLRSHGPAADRDGAWWMGLTLTQTRRAFEAAGARMVPGPGGGPLWLLPEAPEIPPPRWAFVGGFDEYVLGYADRSAVVEGTFRSRVITTNGLFRPVVLHQGRAVGVWKRGSGPEYPDVQADWFGPPPAGAAEALSGWSRWLEGFSPRS